MKSNRPVSVNRNVSLLTFNFSLFMSFRADRIYLEFLRLTRRLSNQQIMMLLAVVVGVLAGLGTYLFEMLLHGIKSGLIRWFPVDSAHILFLIYPAVGIILATLFVKYIVRDNISEGVTRVLYAMSRRNSRIARHNCWTSIVGGATTIGFGGSVGPEAPIVLTGAAIGSNIGRLARLNYKHTTLLLCCGAAAALSAVFKAPITGVVFVLEILMLDITVASIIPLLISTVTATTLMFFLNGFEPVFNLDVKYAFQLRNLPYYALLGLICGLMSYYFTQINGRIAARFARIRGMYRKWIVGGLLIGTLIFLFPPLYGEGYESVVDLMHGNVDALFNNSLFFRYRSISWVVMLYLLATLFLKVVAMSATNGAGGVGGSFAPSLFVGAFTGATMVYMLNALLGLELPIIPFTLVGMAGVMSGVMKAPLTSIFLIAELTSGYALFVPLMLVSALSFAVGYYLEPYSIYTKKLSQSGELLTHNKDRSVLVFLDLKSLVETDFHPITMNTTLGDVVKLISSVRRNIFPVVSRDGTLLGVVQLDDLRADMFDTGKYGTTIDNYMIPPPEQIYPNEQIGSVLKAFEESKAWMLPVVTKENKYVGFISKSRILAAYREQLIAISEE